MPPLGKELSKDLKDTIIKLYKKSKSQRQIVKIIGKYPATVQKIIEKFQAEGTLKHGGGSITPASKLRFDGSFPFQQDNDPKHTARIVREGLLYNVRKQVKTPPQSPNLNSIEHLWDYLDRQIRKQEIKTKNDLKKVLLEEWQKIPSSVTQNLVKSVPSRLRASQI
ncbi:tc1-like transposase protein [Trichonephila clavipes]|nr:tc1-like transposase protein [Trichonephila clavipes]